MGYVHVFSIFDGVQIPRSITRLEFETLTCLYLTNKRNSKIVKQCAEYHGIDLEEVDENNFIEFLHDQEILIDCEFLDYFYLGTSAFDTDSNNGQCWSMRMDEIPKFPAIEPDVFEFIKTVFPHFPIDRYFIHWVV